MTPTTLQHSTLDGFGGHRSRFDDIRLVHELLEELPERLGLQPAMPPMLLPYYNGVEPDDCGVSGFVFLPGGHLTLHTFSFRECYFADLVAPVAFDNGELTRLLRTGLEREGFEVFQHRQVSPGDGGLSYGQAVVGAAILASGLALRGGRL